ncbi:hypothetical protein OSB04_009950 [Centaurea solstitialis]|uniref:Uncharacterized protein n=1 Tax=Centaurea solstitialis TaxID=347529 RepID=A0AA38WNV0_9ASTR|nr:hypothetical protein OSB04_009950 [Centaurea solstitialis]
MLVWTAMCWHKSQKHPGPLNTNRGMLSRRAMFAVKTKFEIMQAGGGDSRRRRSSAGFSNMSMAVKILIASSGGGIRSKFSEPSGKPTSPNGSWSSSSWMLSFARERDGRKRAAVSGVVTMRYPRPHWVQTNPRQFLDRSPTAKACSPGSKPPYLQNASPMARTRITFPAATITFPDGHCSHRHHLNRRRHHLRISIFPVPISNIFNQRRHVKIRRPTFFHRFLRHFRKLPNPLPSRLSFFTIIHQTFDRNPDVVLRHHQSNLRFNVTNPNPNLSNLHDKHFVKKLIREMRPRDHRHARGNRFQDRIPPACVTKTPNGGCESISNCGGPTVDDQPAVAHPFFEPLFRKPFFKFFGFGPYAPYERLVRGLES